MLHAASMIHASGCFVLPYWLRGGTAAILPGFSPASYVEAIERWRPDALNLVPTMLQMLFQPPGIDAADLSSVETIVYGASPMPRPVLEQALGAVGPGLRPILRPDRSAARHLPPRQGGPCRRVARAAALLRPAERRDARSGWSTRTGDDVAPGEPGEIVLRAPFVMKGYTDPALTAAAFLPGGWLRTRDIGRFDEEGYLTLVDRTSDMIVTGGYNVYPREVEDVLAAPSRGRAGRGGRPSRRHLGRGGHRLRRAARRRRGRRGGADRPRPRPSRRLQGAQIGPLRRVDPAEPGRQAAAAGAARAVLGREGSGRI